MPTTCPCKSPCKILSNTPHIYHVHPTQALHQLASTSALSGLSDLHEHPATLLSLARALYILLFACSAADITTVHASLVRALYSAKSLLKLNRFTTSLLRCTST